MWADSPRVKKEVEVAVIWASSRQGRERLDVLIEGNRILCQAIIEINGKERAGKVSRAL